MPSRINILAIKFALPQIREGGQTTAGPVAGGHAEVQYAGLHKAWTATRLLAAVSTMGFSLALGRKEKGAATLVVNYGNGAVRTRRLRTRELGNAQRYAALFNGLAGGSPVCGLCSSPIGSSEAMAVDHWGDGVHLVHLSCPLVGGRGFANFAASQDDEDRAYNQAMRDRPRWGHDSTIQTPGVER